MAADVSEESKVRRLVEQWARAVNARDLKGVLADHAEDIVMFDVPPPVELRGIDAYRDSWPPFFKWLEDERGSFEIVRLDVTAGDTVAFATALLRCGTKVELAKNDTARLRLTVGLRKIDGAWKIAHEHHSFPAEP